MLQILIFFFLLKIATFLEKSQPPLSQQHPFKSWGPPFLEICLEVQLPKQKEGGVHTMLFSEYSLKKQI